RRTSPSRSPRRSSRSASSGTASLPTAAGRGGTGGGGGGGGGGAGRPPGGHRGRAGMALRDAGDVPDRALGPLGAPSVRPPGRGAGSALLEPPAPPGRKRGGAPVDVLDLDRRGRRLRPSHRRRRRLGRPASPRARTNPGGRPRRE